MSYGSCRKLGVPEFARGPYNEGPTTRVLYLGPLFSGNSHIITTIVAKEQAGAWKLVPVLLAQLPAQEVGVIERFTKTMHLKCPDLLLRPLVITYPPRYSCTGLRTILITTC